MKNMAIARGMKKSILVALLLCLVLDQIQVEAKSCCKTLPERLAYNSCRKAGGSRPVCATLSGCKIMDVCKPPYDRLSLDQDIVEEVDVLKFCKLGCAFSVCNKINAALGNEEASNAIDSCDNECSNFCTEHVGTATVVA